MIEASEINEKELIGVPFWKGLEVAGRKVNIYADFDKEFNDDCGIPSCSFYEEEDNESKYSVIHLEQEEVALEVNPEKTCFILACPKEEISQGRALLHLALCLTERERQLAGGALTHGSAVETPSGKGILFLGNQGAGKTTIAVNLGLRGYSLIGNDQVILERPLLEEDKVFLFGGTKYLMVRESAVLSGHLPLSRENFPDNGSSSWENKIKIDPLELGIRKSEGISELNSTFIIHIDPTGREKIHLERITPKDIKTNLFLGEKLARHISGVATHVMSDSGYLLSHTPSLDDSITRNNRRNLIYNLYDKGVYRIYGSDVNEIIYAIEDLIGEA
jgi:hypothetical protein